MESHSDPAIAADGGFFVFFLIMGMPKLGFESSVVSTASSPGVQEQE